MADIAAPTTVAPVLDTEPETHTYIAAVAITVGQVLYQNSSGKAAKAKADATSTSDVIGIALNSADAGKPVTVLQRGSLSGFDLSGVAYNGHVWLSAATVALLATAVTVTSTQVVVPIGKCIAMSDGSNLTKVLFVAIPHLTTYTALP
jgi:Uncharacterized conserved protein (DUF2190)